MPATMARVASAGLFVCRVNLDLRQPSLPSYVLTE